MEPQVCKILTWAYVPAAVLAPWDYDTGILGGTGRDDSVAFCFDTGWDVPASAGPKAFEEAFSKWQSSAMGGRHDGQSIITANRLMVWNEDLESWKIGSLGIVAGPMSFESAAAMAGDFKIDGWFDRPSAMRSSDGKWYVITALDGGDA